MKKKQKKQAEMLEKRIQEMEGGGAEGEEEEEEDEETTTETTEDTTSTATLSMSATLQDIANHTITGGWDWDGGQWIIFSVKVLLIVYINSE